MNYKRSLALLFIIVMLSGCSVVGRIAEYNLEELYTEDIGPSKAYISLPESTYIKNNLELSMMNPTTLNPLDGTDYSVNHILKLIYEPLFNFSGSYEIEPILVSSYEKIQEKNYTIHLKENVTFHNETPFTAEDVLYSYNYIISKEVSTYAYVKQYIESITVINDYELDVKFKRIDWFNLYALSFPIISKDYIESKEYNPLMPIGTGLYQYKSFQSMLDMSLGKYPNYHESVICIDEISITIGRTLSDSFNMFLSKRIDYYAPEITDWLNYSDDTSIHNSLYSSPFYFYIGINHKKSRMGDINTRAYIASLIDYNAIKKDVFLNHLELTPLPIFRQYNIVASMEPYYNNIEDMSSYYRGKYNEDEGINYYNQLAQSKVLKDGYIPDVFRIIYEADNNLQVRIAEQLKKDLHGKNILFLFIPMTKENYAQAIIAGNYDLYLGLYKTGVIPDLASLFTTGGVLNYGGYSNMNIDGLISTYRMVSTDEQFIKQLENMAKVISNDLPIIPIGFLENGLFIHNQIEGVNQPTFFNIFSDLQHLRVTISEAQK